MVTLTNPTPAGRGWRFRLGLICFIAAFAIHLVTLATVVAGASANTVGAVAAFNFALNKVLLILSAAILGKSGFNDLKQLVFGAVKRFGPAQEVGVWRYRIGLVLFLAPLIVAWATPYFDDIAPSLGRHSVEAGIVSDAIFVLSLFLLGGGFWDKLRALFIREVRVAFPGEASEA